MKLTATMFLSVDGVYQGPGGPTEDPSGGFDRGGWLVPHFDEETGQFMGRVFGEVDAFLLGRRTYEIFKSYWPKVADETGTALNTLPKHVVSRTMTSSDWQPTDFVSDVSGVDALKARNGRELQVHGSGELVRSLLAHDLVDELRLLVFPVIVGAGRRLFPDAGPATGLELTEARTTPSGVAILVYRPTGHASFGEVPPAQ